MFNRKFIILIWAVCSLPQLLFAQQRSIAYLGQGIVEMEYSDYREEFVETATLNIPTKIVFKGNKFSFKRGANEWLVNTISYKGRELLGSDSYEAYLDNLGQKMLFSAENGLLFFSFENEKGKKETICYQNLSPSAYVMEEWEEKVGRFLGKEAEKAAEEEEKGQFRRIYNFVAHYDVEKGAWGDWQKGYNTFLFNYNGNSDIKVYYQNGEQEILRCISKEIESGTNEQGYAYQGMRYIDSVGNELRVILYADPSIGVLMGWEGGRMIQFVE